MTAIKSQMMLPDGSGGFDLHHPETEVSQVIEIKDNYRQPSTAYTVGAIAYHASLPTGYYLECTTQGTTGSGDITPTSTIGSTVSDGTVTWTVCKDIGTGNAPIYAGFNQKQTFTSSGSFSAPVTGLYKITLQGAGGGGGGCSDNQSTTKIMPNIGGGGGGAGACIIAYEKLIAGQSYSFTIGAGGAGGISDTDGSKSGSNGGASSVTLNSNAYVAGGGGGGYNHDAVGQGGDSGIATVNSVAQPFYNGENGEQGRGLISGSGYGFLPSGNGGGTHGGKGGVYLSPDGVAGGGGAGGTYTNQIGVSEGRTNGGAGGDGYITFEWLDTSLL